MDPALADTGNRIAAKRWRGLLVRRDDETSPADPFASILGLAAIRPEQAGLFQIAPVAEIEDRYCIDLIHWEAAVPPSGAGLRKFKVLGTKAPSEVVGGAYTSGQIHAPRYLPEGAMTAINSGRVVSYSRKPAGLEPTGVAALSRGGAS